MACLASSPGRMSLTEVWISRDEMVDFLLYEASLEASEAMRSKMSLTKELSTTRQQDAQSCKVANPLEDQHGLV